VLSDPKRLKTGRGHGFLVSWKHKLRVESEAAAQDLARRLLSDPDNVEEIRAALGRPEASPEELEGWLATGLAAKSLIALKTRPGVPVFDPPKVTNLADLVPTPAPEGQTEARSWIAFRAVDRKGRALPFLEMGVTDHAATDLSTRGDADARVRVDELPSDELHTATVRWAGPGTSAPTNPTGVLPGVHEPCWMKLELVDRRGRPVTHLHPVVDTVRAQPKANGAFLAAGMDESDLQSVTVDSGEQS
jgi:hypothetical protein